MKQIILMLLLVVGSTTANLIHLWQYKDGAWKTTRVISYDHGPAK